LAGPAPRFAGRLRCIQPAPDKIALPFELIKAAHQTIMQMFDLKHILCEKYIEKLIINICGSI
jgi:hypothetical protein